MGKKKPSLICSTFIAVESYLCTVIPKKVLSKINSHGIFDSSFGWMDLHNLPGQR